MSKGDRDDFRFRQVHLDFHTSEHIEGVGLDFEPDAFVSTLKAAKVNSVTLFARCHHGWAYYPSGIAAPHPHLARPDLLGDMIEACHGEDISTPIYLPVQWDELTARLHPEWRVMQAENRAANYPYTEPSAGNQLTATWHPVCVNHPGLIERQIRIALEVVERYAPPSLFMDILSSWECCCNACLASMQAVGLDPFNALDRKANDKAVLLAFFRRFEGAISERFPDLRIFFNSGHLVKGEIERYRHYGHLELESLPSGGWGYDHFPASARYAAGLDKPYLGMTGRFHTHWGEFGGYKTADALIFECCQIVALGGRCSIGDQLHPRGRIDTATYDLIRPAYERVEALEAYARGGVYQCEVAFLSVEAQRGEAEPASGERASMSDLAAARTLLELKIPFDVIEEDWDLQPYRLLILPDNIRVDAHLSKHLEDFVANGGALLATGRSGLDRDGRRFNLGIEATLGEPVRFDPSYMTTDGLDPALPAAPIVMYAMPLGLRGAGAEVLAEIRPSYFNRAWDKFCSHLHTPEDPTAPSIGPAILQTGKIIHCAYPLFRLYAETGQVNYKYVLRNLIERLLPDLLMGTDLPSAARMALVRQEESNRNVLHLLYAPTQLRGAGMTYNDGQTRPVEIIEDAPRLTDVSAWLRQPAAPTEVISAYDAAPLPWTYDPERQRLTVTFPTLHIHQAAVIVSGPGA